MYVMIRIDLGESIPILMESVIFNTSTHPPQHVRIFGVKNWYDARERSCQSMSVSTSLNGSQFLQDFDPT